MNKLNDSDAIFRYHRDMAALHGANSSLALGWLSSHDQEVRFEALTGIADLNGKTILDAGCGYGDLFPFLTKNNKIAHYYGVEQIPELIDEAIARYSNTKNITFIASDFLTIDLPVADYVLASGSLNYGSTSGSFIFEAITTLFKHCRLGLAFNLLLTIPQNGLIVAYEPDIILEHCRSLSSKVKFHDGYAKDDFTIWMYR